MEWGHRGDRAPPAGFKGHKRSGPRILDPPLPAASPKELPQGRPRTEKQTLSITLGKEKSIFKYLF